MHAPCPQQIQDNFDRFSQSYDANSAMQQRIARLLIDHLPKDTAPQSILELGCGTGHLTRHLAALYPQAQITASDISPAMLELAQKNIPAAHNIKFSIIDAQNPQLNDKFDLIISSMSIQWLPDIPAAYKNWRTHLNEKGLILTARPAKAAFKEWKASLQACGLTDGTLPFQETPFAKESITLRYAYPDTLSFLKSIHNAGAATPQSGYRPLSPRQLKQACAYCDAQFNATLSWSIVIDALTQ